MLKVNGMELCYPNDIHVLNLFCSWEIEQGQAQVIDVQVVLRKAKFLLEHAQTSIVGYQLYKGRLQTPTPKCFHRSNQQSALDRQKFLTHTN